MLLAAAVLGFGIKNGNKAVLTVQETYIEKLKKMWA